MRPAPAENLEDFLHVAWDPRPAETRCALTRRRFIAAVGGLVVTLLVWGGYYGWTRYNGDTWQGTGQWPVSGVVVGLAVVLVVVRLVLWRLAVRHRRRVGKGEVVTASWPGIQIAGHYWDWDRFAAAGTGREGPAGVAAGGAGVAEPAVASAAATATAPGVPEAVVATVPGTRGRGDRYVVTTPEGTWECDIDDLAVSPAALDQALRLYSRGRCRVDLSGIAH
ncbi:hypothetical protein [Raineyella sp. LH-20]|uniref:hypothetical protein n=1 Tax=Raineyella sp. LH-20 TaxID=3081204 RepID=UPI0029542CDA|nr:hypothetical protein [Raineyella sp. LH-20]WOP20131.1 hypothetical protein R0146_07600 [Raineyella sp. LH-20]